MGFKCGIVGLPNVGKSTLFNALTHAGIAAENYPFCTVEPNVGIVAVPDERLQTLKKLVKPQNCLPTSIKFVDIAGLVQGAAQGEGLGNKFLAHIRETDAIVHVVRCFDNEQIVHVNGRIAPCDDIAIIDTELALADLETLDKACSKLQKHIKSGDKVAQNQHRILSALQEHMNQGAPARTFVAPDEVAQAYLQTLHLLTNKPVLYVANVAEQNFGAKNTYRDEVAQHAAQQGAQLIDVCAAIEMEVAELSAEDAALFLADLGLTETGRTRIIRAGQKLLNLQVYFTAGPKEVRAWTIPVGANAVEAAGVIHSDFATGFIRAEVIAYADYVQHEGEQGAKNAGCWRLEGKDYIVQDADVMHFRFNV